MTYEIPITADAEIDLQELPRGQGPHIQHPAGCGTIGITFRQYDPAIDHDGAVPMAPSAGKCRDALAGGRVIDIDSAATEYRSETSAGVVDEQQTTGFERTGTAGVVAPLFV